MRPSSISTMRASRSRAACCSAAAARRGTMRWPGAMRAPPTDRGVDIIQNCEVTGFIRENGVTGVETTRGPSARQKSAWRSPATPRASRRWPACGCRSRAMCCRPSCPKGLKPLIPRVITFGAGHFYISQSDKGGLVFGGDIDGYNSYAQRGNLPTIEDVCEGGMALMPMIGRVRMLRHGAASWTCRWTARRSSTGRRSTGSISTPAGAMAASRRRRPPAGASPI
jgi:glycine/D-amino acid oxidase-like deaminating enzyme